MNKNVHGFRKFSEMNEGKKLKEVGPSDPHTEVQPSSEADIPMNPNLPKASKKVQRMASRNKIVPKDQNVDLPKEADEPTNEDNTVKMYGKVAKFPKKVKASKALNFLENVKISKNSIWYILVEQQGNELQMVKYNNKRGVDLGKFIGELKSFYIKKYAENPNVQSLIESIVVSGAEEFSSIKNIPNIEIGEGKKLISKITEDLIKLLSK